MDRVEAAVHTGVEARYPAVKSRRIRSPRDDPTDERESRIAALLARGGLRAAAAASKALPRSERPDKSARKNDHRPQETDLTT